MSQATLTGGISFLMDQTTLFLRLQQREWRLVVPKVAVRAETDRFVVKTVDSRGELSQALRLRYQVFHREMMGKKIPIGFDIDAFDFECDHIVIVEKGTDKVVGTYRLLCSRFTHSFYSQTEFDLDGVLRLPGTKIELGRACVADGYRSGPVIGLLWRGIAEYARKTGSKYLFGCTSFKTMDSTELLAVEKYLQRSGHYSELARVEALPEFAPDAVTGDADAVQATKLIPKLFVSYIRAGAKVCSGPAVDRAMKCTDFLTLLDIEQMHQSFAKKFDL